MKMLTLVCLIAASAVATAATTTATTTATTNKINTAKMNKAIQKKAAKKAASEIQTTAVPVEQTTSVTTPNEVLPPTGTSTTAAPAAAPKNDFGGSITSDTTADQSTYKGTEAVQSATVIGGKYQISEATKTGLSVAFESATNKHYKELRNEELAKNNFRSMFLEPYINTTLTNFVGTDRTAFGFNLRFVDRNSFAGGGADHRYTLSSNSTIAINPKFSATLYNEFRAVQFIDGRAMGTKISVIPGVGYAINDAISFYQLAGYVMNTQDGEAFRNQRERVYLETGVNYSPAALSGFNINLLVSQDKMIASQAADEKVSSLSIYDSNNNKDTTSSNDYVAYEAILNYSF
ncbi:MAG: hypothetical protein H7Z71_06710 [Moraxellaceae bacterium]|nr:hypothetical protein [Pseudobdellovibrionaceae bacterium]